MSKKDDEEITIDFGSFFSKFKKKKHPQQEKHQPEEKKEEASEQEDETVSLDHKQILEFFKKYGYLFLLLIPIILTIYFRSMTGYLPVTDDWARNSVYAAMKNQIMAQIDKDHPNVPVENKNAIVEKEFQKLLQDPQMRANLEQQIQLTSEYFRSQLQDDSGHTYLLEIDPWTYYKDSKNIIDHGYVGEELRNGTPWDTLSFAPIGAAAGTNLHIYLQAYIYKIVHIFNPNVDLRTVVFYMPVLLGILIVIPAFFIARRKAGNIAGLVSGIVVATSVPLLGRTIAGFSDTDSYNILFPLYIAWSFFEAFEAKNIKKSIFLAAVSGALVGLYSFAWSGWWYIFDFMIVSVVLYFIVVIVNIYIRNNKKFAFHDITSSVPIRRAAVTFVIFFITATLIVQLIVTGSGGLRHALWGGPISVIQFKEVSITTIWPNVNTTVAEQNASTLKNTIDGIGGMVLFLLSLGGIIFMFFKKDDEGHMDIKYSLLLSVWYFGTIYGSIKGVRYIILLAPAFGIALGIMFGFSIRILSKYFAEEFKLNKVFTTTALIILFGALLFVPRNIFQEAKVTGMNEIPLINDAWYDALVKLKENSAPDAIVTSWWDYGHWFKTIAQRRVTFDGGTQNTPMAHWVGRALLTDNEDEAMGILRMLDCGTFMGEREMEAHLNNNTYKAINLLKQIILMDREDAKKTLLQYMDNEQAEEILNLTHCNPPPEAYFITSEDMVGKSGVWAHFGAWNFTRSLMVNRLLNLNFEESIIFLKNELNLTDEQARVVYYEVKSVGTGERANSWIAPWPSYASGPMACNKVSNTTLQCQQNVVINLTSMEAYIETSQATFHPKTFSYVAGDEVITKEYNESIFTDGNRLFGITLLPDTNQIIFMDYQLTGSMFTRMFYLKGHGLQHFDLFDDRSSFMGNHIIIWKVDWEGKSKLISYNSTTKNS